MVDLYAPTERAAVRRARMVDEAYEELWRKLSEVLPKTDDSKAGLLDAFDALIVARCEQVIAEREARP